MSDENSKTPSNNSVIFNALKKKFKGLDTLPQIEPVSSHDILQSPSVGLNLICGKDKGFRKGSLVLWYGPYSSLKSWIALEMCREAQHKWPEKLVAYFDTECRVDIETAVNQIGIEVQPSSDGVPRFVYRRPRTAESAWEEIGAFAASGLFSIIVLDSNTAMVPEKVDEDKEFKFGQIGLAARISSAALMKYTPKLIESGTIFWVISQRRMESQGQLMIPAPTGGQAWRFYACFSGDTKLLTWEHGVVPFNQIVGEQVKVLTRQGFKIANIVQGITQKIWNVEVIRNNSKRIIRTTADHKWFVNRTTKHRQEILTTKELEPGFKIPRVVSSKLNHTLKLSSLGILHGMVFGDGTLESSSTKGSRICLWGEKDKQLLRYLPSDCTFTELETKNGVKGILARNAMPRYFKSKPDINESTQYLFGFLAGYFAADGSVDKAGRASIVSANKSNLEMYQQLCIRCGIAFEDITETESKSGYKENSIYYKMTLDVNTIPESFFLIREHLNRIQRRNRHQKYDNSRWTITAVYETNVTEPVFCAIVPELQEFVLEGNILTHNTHEISVEALRKEKEGEDYSEDLEIKVRMKKNKFARSLLSHTIPTRMGLGINQEADILLTALEEGLVQQAGAYYKYQGENIGQGLEKACQALKDSPELKSKLLDELYRDE